MKNILDYNGIVADQDSLTVTYKGKIVDLRPKEYSILLLLLSHPDRVFTYTDIVDSLWSFDKIPTEGSIRSHIKAVRKAFRKVGATENIIENVHGVGYRLKISNKILDFIQNFIPALSPVFHNFITSKAIEYLAIAEDLTIESISPNLFKYCDYPEWLQVGISVVEPFPEFIGLEETLDKIRTQEMSHFSIQGIARNFNQKELEYLNFYIVAEGSQTEESSEQRLLYIFFEDVSEQMMYKQRAIQQDHEANLRNYYLKLNQCN